MAKGKVAFFKSSGGYGFTETDDHNDDMFFYMEDIEGPDLEEDQKAELDVEEIDKGPRMTNVTRL